MKPKVIYFQNPEGCQEQSFWVRDEDEPAPTAEDAPDGWIGGNGWPIEFMVKGTRERADYWADQFAHECLQLAGPYRWEYVDICD